MENSSSVTTIDLLRHGACLWPPGFYGTSDNPLSPEGMQQMMATVERYGLPYHKVFCSPLSRCLSFSQRWCSEHPPIPLSEEPGLIEGELGAWEGQTVQQLQYDDPSALEHFWLDPLGNAPEGAESLRHMQHRIENLIERLLQRHQGQQLLLVSHSGLIRAFVMCLLASGPDAWRVIRVPHGGLTRVRYYHQSGSADWRTLEFHGLTEAR